MLCARPLVAAGAVGILLLGLHQAPAQQVTIGTPYNNLSDGFYENFGTSWGLSGKNFFFRQGGSPTSASPQFGGFDPSSGLSGGWANNGGKLNGFFNFNYSQGYRQNFTSQTPMVTMMNGQTAYFSDTSQSPFVIGQIPVVGGFPVLNYGYPRGTAPVYSMYAPGQALPVTNPHNHRVEQFIRQQEAEKQRQAQRQAQLEQAAQRIGRFDPNKPPAPQARRPAPPMADEPVDGDLDLVAAGQVAPPAEAVQAGPAERLAATRGSSAGRAVPSVAEARRLHQAEQATGDSEARALFERGRTAEEGGKPNVAKVYYRMAVRQADGPLRHEIQTHLDRLDSPGTP